jgi:hypothetical protein
MFKKPDAGSSARMIEKFVETAGGTTTHHAALDLVAQLNGHPRYRDFRADEVKEAKRAARAKANKPEVWSAQDHKLSQLEGWWLIENAPEPGWALQSTARPHRFDSALEAVGFVQAMATHGSHRHQRALKLAFGGQKRVQRITEEADNPVDFIAGANPLPGSRQMMVARAAFALELADFDERKPAGFSFCEFQGRFGFVRYADLRGTAAGDHANVEKRALVTARQLAEKVPEATVFVADTDDADCRHFEFGVFIALEHTNPEVMDDVARHVRLLVPEAFPIDKVVTAYLACALWSSTDMDGSSLDDSYDIDDISTEGRREAEEVCRDFVQANAELLEGLSPEQVGHDFWLTRNRHGAGFWDRGLGARGKALTEAAQVYSGCDITVGDDGKLYLS